MDNLQNGINAFKSGQKEEARKFFIAAIKENPQNENVWGWMYQVANSDIERVECLKRAIAVNPQNSKAKELLDKLTAPLPLTIPPVATLREPPQIIQPQKIIEPVVEKKKCNPLYLIIFAVVSMFLVLCCLFAIVGNSTGSSKNFTKVGYFKDSTNNRIFTISFNLGTSEDKIRTYAEGLRYTSGQLTAAYFYPEGSIIPADGVTLASSVFEANDVLYEAPGLSKWRYAYMRYLNGTLEFIDCEKEPDNGLCRKK